MRAEVMKYRKLVADGGSFDDALSLAADRRESAAAKAASTA